jgi:uncharacterized caspase-like protein
LIRLAGILALASLAACPSAEKREAERIVAAIERVRMAQPDGRGPLLEALEKERADAALAETARSRCAAAYRAMHEARAAMASIEERMASKEGDEALRLLADLDAAQAKLTEAEKEMPGCESALRELRASLR